MELDDPPPIFTYLLDFDDSKTRLHLLFRDKLVRGPWSGLSDPEGDALAGIAFMRHPHLFQECDRPHDQAYYREMLDRHPHILKRFRQEFPFVRLRE